MRSLSQAEETHQLTCREGFIDGHKCTLILDSAASISLFPAEMVKTSDGGKVTIVSSVGRREVETAVVDIIVDGTCLQKRVALLPSSKEGIMSIDLNKERDRMIVDSAVGCKSKVAVEEVQINHVVTRSMAKAEEEEKTKELTVIMEECPVVKELRK